jgi:hypothetical protein
MLTYGPQNFDDYNLDIKNSMSVNRALTIPMCCWPSTQQAEVAAACEALKRELMGCPGKGK